MAGALPGTIHVIGHGPTMHAPSIHCAAGYLMTAYRSLGYTNSLLPSPQPGHTRSATFHLIYLHHYITCYLGNFGEIPCEI